MHTISEYVFFQILDFMNTTYLTKQDYILCFFSYMPPANFSGPCLLYFDVQDWNLTTLTFESYQFFHFQTKMIVNVSS